MDTSLGAGLSGRGVLVTGAAGGIGAAVCRSLAAVGARIAAVDRDADAVDAVLATLDGDGHATLAVDLRDVATHPELVHRAATAVGPLRALVHTAAVIVRRPDLTAVTVEDWDLQHDVNLRATFFLARAAAEHMRERGDGGRIVAFTSQAWWTGGLDGSLAYAASKGGVVSLVRGLAREYAADAITVNAVAPGAVDTPMLTDEGVAEGTPGDEPSGRGRMTAEALERFAAQIPLGRFARPDEIAGAVVFLCSDHAGYVTGATLNLTGGQLMY